VIRFADTVRRRVREAFGINPLEEMIAIGAVGPRSVRIWARAPGEKKVMVQITPSTALPGEWSPASIVEREVDEAADETIAFDVPGDTPGLDPLLPERSYRVCVRALDGRVIGQGRFSTASEDVAKLHFAFAMASCHQPFDSKGKLVPESMLMLEGVTGVLQAHDVRFLLQLGDQIYADYPPSHSLFGRFFRTVAPEGRNEVFDCTREEIRKLYHERHRIFFGVKPFAALQSQLPTYPILDDHEIRDNYGSSPDHSSEKWRAIREGARDAFFDYQASRVLRDVGVSFHYSFANGPVGVFVMDLRSERRADDRIVSVVSDNQFHDLEKFLHQNAERPVAAIVVSVPVAHVDSKTASVGLKLFGQASDIADRWSNPKAIADRNRLLRIIRAHQRAHPAQRVVLLGGDIHVGCLFRIDWDDGVPSFFQFTSSALSNVQPRVARWGAEQVPKVLAGIDKSDELSARVAIVPCAEGTGTNPYGGLNLGIVEVRTEPKTELRFKLVGTPGDDGARRIAFDSGWI
jgi:alkaline phosphatase D